MGTYENPSADKFGPPPGEERFAPPKPARTLKWTAALGVLFLIARLALDQIHTTGPTEYLVLAGFVTIGCAEFIRAKRARDTHEDANRPASPTITPR